MGKRILIKKGERAAIAIRRQNAPKCDSKNTGGYTDLVLVGPCSISLVISKSFRSIGPDVVNQNSKGKT